MTTGNSESNTNAHSKVTQIFEFLKAFASLRYSTVLQITDHQWLQLLSQLPEHESISITQEDEIKEWLVNSLEEPDEEDESDEINTAAGNFLEDQDDVLVIAIVGQRRNRSRVGRHGKIGRHVAHRDPAGVDGG